MYEINEHTLKKIEESTASDTEKVFNILRSIDKYVKGNKEKAPYLISIGERAEFLVQLFKRGQIITKEVLNELKRLIEEINEARRQEIEMKMPSDVFTIYWLLKNEGINNPNMANKFGEILKEYPYWMESEKYERELKKELSDICISYGISVDKASELVTKYFKK